MRVWRVWRVSSTYPILSGARVRLRMCEVVNESIESRLALVSGCYSICYDAILGLPSFAESR
jgi:hypothetical protein